MESQPRLRCGAHGGKTCAKRHAISNAVVCARGKASRHARVGVEDMQS